MSDSDDPTSTDRSLASEAAQRPTITNPPQAPGLDEGSTSTPGSDGVSGAGSHDGQQPSPSSSSRQDAPASYGPDLFPNDQRTVYCPYHTDIALSQVYVEKSQLFDAGGERRPDRLAVVDDELTAEAIVEDLLDGLRPSAFVRCRICRNVVTTRDDALSMALFGKADAGKTHLFLGFVHRTDTYGGGNGMTLRDSYWGVRDSVTATARQVFELRNLADATIMPEVSRHAPARLILEASSVESATEARIKDMFIHDVAGEMVDGTWVQAEAFPFTRDVSHFIFCIEPRDVPMLAEQLGQSGGSAGLAGMIGVVADEVRRAGEDRRTRSATDDRLRPAAATASMVLTKADLLTTLDDTRWADRIKKQLVRLADTKNFRTWEDRAEALQDHSAFVREFLITQCGELGDTIVQVMDRSFSRPSFHLATALGGAEVRELVTDLSGDGEASQTTKRTFGHSDMMCAGGDRAVLARLLGRAGTRSSRALEPWHGTGELRRAVHFEQLYWSFCDHPIGANTRGYGLRAVSPGLSGLRSDTGWLRERMWVNQLEDGTRFGFYRSEVGDLVYRLSKQSSGDSRPFFGHGLVATEPRRLAWGQIVWLMLIYPKWADPDAKLDPNNRTLSTRDIAIGSADEVDGFLREQNAGPEYLQPVLARLARGDDRLSVVGHQWASAMSLLAALTLTSKAGGLEIDEVVLRSDPKQLQEVGPRRFVAGGVGPDAHLAHIVTLPGRAPAAGDYVGEAAMALATEFLDGRPITSQLETLEAIRRYGPEAEHVIDLRSTRPATQHQAQLVANIPSLVAEVPVAKIPGLAAELLRLEAPSQWQDPHHRDRVQRVAGEVVRSFGDQGEAALVTAWETTSGTGEATIAADLTMASTLFPILPDPSRLQSATRRRLDQMIDSGDTGARVDVIDLVAAESGWGDLVRVFAEHELDRVHEVEWARLASVVTALRTPGSVRRVVRSSIANGAGGRLDLHTLVDPDAAHHDEVREAFDDLVVGGGHGLGKLTTALNQQVGNDPVRRLVRECEPAWYEAAPEATVALLQGLLGAALDDEDAITIDLERRDRDLQPILLPFVDQSGLDVGARAWLWFRFPDTIALNPEVAAACLHLMGTEPEPVPGSADRHSDLRRFLRTNWREVGELVVGPTLDLARRGADGLEAPGLVPAIELVLDLEHTNQLLQEDLLEGPDRQPIVRWLKARFPAKFDWPTWIDMANQTEPMVAAQAIRTIVARDGLDDLQVRASQIARLPRSEEVLRYLVSQHIDVDEKLGDAAGLLLAEPLLPAARGAVQRLLGTKQYREHPYVQHLAGREELFPPAPSPPPDTMPDAAVDEDVEGDVGDGSAPESPSAEAAEPEEVTTGDDGGGTGRAGSIAELPGIGRSSSVDVSDGEQVATISAAPIAPEFADVATISGAVASSLVGTALATRISLWFGLGLGLVQALAILVALITWHRRERRVSGGQR